MTIGEEVINTTQTHPFYVEGKGYVEAAELKVGDVLRGLDDSEIKIEKVEIEDLNEPIKVYNFTVEDWHNYFVSYSSVLVHNANCGGDSSGKGDANLNNTAKGTLKATQLPIKGNIRYIPPQKWTSSQALPKQNGGIIDKFGNLWTKGPSRTNGQPFERDVQLPKTEKNQLGWASRDNSHLNVSLDGKITHK